MNLGGDERILRRSVGPGVLCLFDSEIDPEFGRYEDEAAVLGFQTSPAVAEGVFFGEFFLLVVRVILEVVPARRQNPVLADVHVMAPTPGARVPCPIR